MTYILHAMKPCIWTGQGKALEKMLNFYAQNMEENQVHYSDLIRILKNLLNISRYWQKMLSFSYCSVRIFICIVFHVTYTLCTIIRKVQSFHKYIYFSLKMKSLSFQNQEKFELCNFIALILRVMPMDEVNL